MKVCGISDIHGNLLENVPECDVLCIAGDVVTLNAQRNYNASEYWWKNRFVPWVMKLKCEKVLVVPGNHDIYLENLYLNGKWEEFCDYMAITTYGKLHFLIDQSFEYEGINFYGTPWIDPIEFQENLWAFQVKSYKEDNPYSKIPNCDILITHDSPFKNKQLFINSNGKSVYHLYGHWHDGESNPEKGKYNCSRLNEFYSFKKNFEIPTITISKTMENKSTKEIREYLVNLLMEMVEADYDKDAIELIESKIDLLVAEENLEKEDKWNESFMINDIDTNSEESIEDERK